MKICYFQCLFPQVKKYGRYNFWKKTLTVFLVSNLLVFHSYSTGVLDILFESCFQDKPMSLGWNWGFSEWKEQMWTGKLPRHGTCTCHFYICMSLCDSIKVLSILKFSFNASNSIFRNSLFNRFELSHPKKTLTRAHAVWFSQCFLSLAGSIWEVILKCTSDILEISMPACRWHFPDVLRKYLGKEIILCILLQ